MKRIVSALLSLTAGSVVAFTSQAADAAAPQAPTTAPSVPKPDFPPSSEVMKDYQEVISTIDKSPSLFSVWVRHKDDQVLAAFPQKFEMKKFFIAMTVASGERYAGLQAGDMYVYWKRQNDRMLLIEPNLDTRSTGDDQSKASVSRLFTDRVIADVPIVTILTNNPVIDLRALLVGDAGKFFGNYMLRDAKKQLASIKTLKAFPGNIEVAFEIPMAGGVLKTLHYSISEIRPNPSFKTRVADARVGFFTTSYTDLGKYQDDDSRVRYVNRWHLEKADPSLKVSPPKDPIVFYIENTTPIRYRRWVREGVLMWNKAFEQVGIANAIEVYYQDAATGAHMEKDPEDVRYNFVRWLNNNVGTAIGPSRVNPLTGEILDADIILTDGWIRHFWRQYNEVLPQLAMEGYAPETLEWLKRHPTWDPRIRLAPPAARSGIMEKIMKEGLAVHAGESLPIAGQQLIGESEFDGLSGRVSQVNGLCRAAECKALDMELMRLSLDLIEEEENVKDDAKKVDEKKDEAKKKELLDGVPEWFIGPLISELVAHEVGHTLGLRHNFKASSIYTLEQINSPEFKGKKPYAGSVMDYLPINMYRWDGKPQGDHTMIDVGPYDMWAIQYGYSMDDKPEDLKKILSRVSEPELQYATDEDTWGPDPLARRYDFAANPIAYATNQMGLAKTHRARLVKKFVKDGQSWAKARHGYEMTLAVQQRSLSMMAGWLGGAFVNRDHKGDPKNRAPIEVVPTAQQREALEFVIENSFYDRSFGLSPELLQHMTTDKWWDDGGIFMAESTWAVHDRIMGIQASVLTSLLNPTTLSRVFDNEYTTPADQDMITLPELLDDIHRAIWTELRNPTDKTYSARQPMISSLRRNLQREYLDRLIDLSMPDTWGNASHKPISNLALHKLRQLQREINDVLKNQDVKLDAYTEGHLSEAKLRIEKATDASYIYNASQFGGGGGTVIYISGEEKRDEK
ncbi:MAG TPA: zinc-dependent metalloprotease [Verrucomicrobiae bacterium]|nr:zinc-dependent metalloprotease [Verrucomicrobiae bacterium]